MGINERRCYDLHFIDALQTATKKELNLNYLIKNRKYIRIFIKEIEKKLGVDDFGIDSLFEEVSERAINREIKQPAVRLITMMEKLGIYSTSVFF